MGRGTMDGSSLWLEWKRKKAAILRLGFVGALANSSTHGKAVPDGGSEDEEEVVVVDEAAATKGGGGGRVDEKGASRR